MNDPFHPNGLPAPGPDALAHGRRAEALIRRRIEEEGPIPFSDYMELCLNAPGIGYYTAGSRKFGPEGDFVTAPEISPLFGRSLARAFGEVLDLLGGGEVLELGGGTGAFAESCLGELARRDAAPRRYRILEPSPDLRERQRRRLEPLGVEWLDSLPDEPFSGIVFANEVADALPVERFRIAPEGVESMHVGLDSEGFRWVARPAARPLRDHVRAVETRLGRPIGAAGYESEWCPSLGGWLEAVAGRLDRGLVLVFDYGYGEAEYYHPDRDRGTLGCHYRHRWHDDPLVLPALQDITASVDFSALARAGDGAGLDRVGFTTQAWFLLGCGLTRLLAESAAAEGDEDGPRPRAPPAGAGEVTRETDTAARGTRRRTVRGARARRPAAHPAGCDGGADPGARARPRPRGGGGRRPRRVRRAPPRRSALTAGEPDPAVMDLTQAIVLALVQGLTEFLPISSSAHLILVPALLGWPDQGLAFDVAVHVGSLAAVVAYLRRDLRELAGGWLRSVLRARPFSPESHRGWMVIAATVPVGTAGLLAGEAVAHHLRTPAVIALANLVFAFALLAADRWGSGTRGAESLGIRGAVLIGCAQALALVPGASRSGVTITAGLALGLTPRAAARFSFLLAVPVIALAGGAKGYELLSAPGAVDWTWFGIGALVAGVSAYACIGAFLALVARIGLWPFAVYRIALGAILLIVLAPWG